MPTLFARAFAAAALCFVSAVHPLRAAEAAARLLVLSKAESKLAIIDPHSLAVIATVPTGNSPHEVAVSADASTAYVADYGMQTPGNTITVIDIPTAKVLRTVDLGLLRRPHGIVTFAGKVYFTAENNAAVARYDPVENQLDMLIGTGQQLSHMLAIDPNDGRIYTANIGSDSISAIDPQRGPGGQPLIGIVPVAAQPEAIALSPDGRELWTASRAGGSITVVETAGDSVRQVIEFPGAAIRLAFTPDGTRVLASDAANHKVVVIDAKSRKTLAEIPTEEVPVGLVVEPDGKRAFVSCAAAHKVLALDLEQNKVTVQIDAGAVPDGIAFASPRAETPPAPRVPGMFGAQLENLGPADAKKAGLPAPTGVRIVNALPNTPAANAKLAAGDIILSANGTTVPNLNRLLRMLSRSAAGDEMKLEILRGTEKISATVTLAKRPG